MATIDLNTLKSHLWGSANILRGSVDAVDHKNYIFGMFFLKRLSDVFDEEQEKLKKEKHVDLSDPDNYSFYIPRIAHWSYLKTLTQDLGTELNKANAALEEANPEMLENVLSTVDYNDKDRLPDAILSALIAHFSKISLGNSNLENPDMLGDAYEYLIAQFADDAGKKGGGFYTPKEVVTLLVEILDPQERMRICDPACGSGDMLVQSVHHLGEIGQNPKNISLFGQDRNIGTWAICKMNMLLHGLYGARLEKGDTLRNPKLVGEQGKLMEFDIVIANPPFSLKNWGYEEAQNDPQRRFRFGIPPKGYGDYAFVQHMIATLNFKGRAGLVLPHGVLFRGGAEGKIRKGILEEDLLEAVIGLPNNLFFGAGIPVCLFILNKGKPKDHKGKVFFLYGANDYLEGKNQNKLRKEDIEKITTAYREYKTIDRYCRTVSLDEIRANDYNLNITRYIDITEGEEPIDIQAVIRDLQDLKKERAAVEEEMNRYLKKLGFQV